MSSFPKVSFLYGITRAEVVLYLVCRWKQQIVRLDFYKNFTLSSIFLVSIIDGETKKKIISIISLMH